MAEFSWEEAVRYYRQQPGNEGAVYDNYFDLPVIQAARRYTTSSEFAEVLRLLGNGEGRSILDLGAGNGIASFALAKHGWQVTALEPDPSLEVGAGAIRELAREEALPISVIQEWGERLPFQDSCFAAVHARQVLHHAIDLEEMVKESSRVLLPGGLLLATREHVIDDEHQLAAFRSCHPLHHLYGGENAFPLNRYLLAFQSAGFQCLEVWGPLESILNFPPGTTKADQQLKLCAIANSSWKGLGRLLSWHARFRAYLIERAARCDQTPGRIFSFLLKKISEPE